MDPNNAIFFAPLCHLCISCTLFHYFENYRHRSLFILRFSRKFFMFIYWMPTNYVTFFFQSMIVVNLSIVKISPFLKNFFHFFRLEEITTLPRFQFISSIFSQNLALLALLIISLLLPHTKPGPLIYNDNRHCRLPRLNSK